MNKFIAILLCCALMCSSTLSHANDGDLNQYKEDTEALYRTGSGAEEGAYSAISTSMIGWGVGLAVGIAILAGVLHQSTANTAHTPTSQCH